MKTTTEIIASETSCIPPQIFKRNEFGLLCNASVTYVYNEDGTINWRKMVKPEFLVPHKQVLERIGKPIPTDINSLSDRELLILLGGIKELAATRGFSSIRYSLASPTPDYVAAVCEINWLPNYETEGRSVISSGVGDASPTNTTGFGKLYLAPFAENRAFVRCVRQFLRINIVSQEEITEMVSEATEDVATTLLKETIGKFGITFEGLKAKQITEGVENAASWNTLGDIPRALRFELIERIKCKAKAKGLLVD